MGWFKTAASLLNPLGDDKHDLPSNLMLDYNLAISIQSGDAQDVVYPPNLTAEGDPTEELEQLGLFPSGTCSDTEPDAEATLLKEEAV